MGRQVNFYMTESDEQNFVRLVQSDRDICMFMDAVPSSQVQPIEGLPEIGVPWAGTVFLWDRKNSPPPKMDYVPEQEYYMVDSLVSEVIEFSRSFVDGDRLVRGRIWAEMDYWDLEKEPPEALTKSDGFKKWFNRLANWIKRRSVKDQVGDYLLPGAAQYVSNGGKTCQLAFAKDVKVIHHPVD